MDKIKDYERYNQLMRNGMYDKMFFVDKLLDEWNTFIDYGCADGFLTREISSIFPDKILIGYDTDPVMINTARAETALNTKIIWTSDLQKTIQDAGETPDVLYLSSIVHEVYSYRNAEEIEAFWKFVFETGFKYIVIRDMIYDEELQRHATVNTVRKVHAWARQNHQEKFLSQFEQVNGKISNYKNLIHFLLKYEYIANWDREVRENYFPLTIQSFYEMMPAHYRIEYSEHLTLPFHKNKWEKDFGIFVDEKIHSKIILKKI